MHIRLCSRTPRLSTLILATLALGACDDPNTPEAMQAEVEVEGDAVLLGKADEVPSTQQLNLPCRPKAGEVLFVELMPNPAELSDHVAEWIELENVAEHPLLLSGCRLTDRRTIPDSHWISPNIPLVIEPGEIVLLAKTDDPAINGGLVDVVDTFGSNFSLNSSADSPILECDGAIIDEVTYDRDTWPFGRGNSMRLDGDHKSATDNDDPDNWCRGEDEYYPDEHGSPGDSNLPC